MIDHSFSRLKASMLAYLVGPALALTVTAAGAGQVTPERKAELRDLLYQDCGSCHGMRLTGGLGPPLTPEALRDKPRELLIATIRDGRRGTPMPPWGQHLSEAEIAWLVRWILNSPE